MEPRVYAECLKLAAARDGLAPSDLHPVMMNEIIAVEDELGVDLPEQYESFLVTVGAGPEFGGLAHWYHCDLAREGSLIRVNTCLWNGERDCCFGSGFEVRSPKDFLAVYDPCDGSLIGFRRKNGCFHPEVFSWDPGDGGLEAVADDFCGFLSANVDLSPEEILKAEILAGPDSSSTTV